MKKIILSVAFVATMGITAIQAQTQDSTASNNAAASQNAAPTGNVVQAVSQSGYNSVLTSAIKTAGLESSLNTGGPYTIFAPSDQAFSGVAQMDSLLKDPAKLTPALRGHVVNGKYTKADIIKALTDGKGTATLNTIDGGTLTLKVNASKNLELSDASGNTALVTVFDLQGTNGVAHVINNVLLPKQ